MRAVERQSPGAERPLVAFDFDGTLTVRDSYMDFLRWRTTPGRYAAGLVGLAPAAAGYLLHRDRGRLKAAATRRFLRGVEAGQLELEAEGYARARFADLIRPDALARWRDHRAQGARMVIVTATPAMVVAPFARRLGADRLIGTRLQLDKRGRVTGRFAGKNCRGEEKATRLRAAFGYDVRLAAAYGDTSGDKAMLRIADRPGMRVFTRRP